MSDYDIDECPCPACGHALTHSRPCDVIGCEHGWIDEYDDDPVNFAPGEYLEPCTECRGGIQRWCPNCGAGYWRAEAEAEAKAENEPPF